MRGNEKGREQGRGEQGRGRKSSNCRGLLIADMIGAIASHGHKQRRKRDFHYYDQVRCLSLLFGTLCPFPVPLAKRGEIGQLQLQHSTALLLIHHKYTHTHTLHTHSPGQQNSLGVHQSKVASSPPPNEIRYVCALHWRRCPSAPSYLSPAPCCLLFLLPRCEMSCELCLFLYFKVPNP